MHENRSVPSDTLMGHIAYRDLPAAVAWLSRAFAFREHFRYGDPVSGVQMHLGNAFVMLRHAAESSATPAELGYGTQNLTIVLGGSNASVEAHFERARAAGAVIVEEPHETVYGEFQYAARDPEGHLWIFARHARDLSPEAWGAQVAEPAHRLAWLSRPRFCYIAIPAVDPAQSAAFYESVFGWNIRNRDSGHPSFDDATGNISGTWVTDRAPASQPGLLPYIWVDSIEGTLSAIVARGGHIVAPPVTDNPGADNLTATFRDPAGNLLGLYQELPG